VSARKLLQGPLLFPLVPTAQTCSPKPPTKERSHTSFIEMTVLLAAVSCTDQRECSRCSTVRYAMGRRIFGSSAGEARQLLGIGVVALAITMGYRPQLSHVATNWLFFGERSASTDSLYREELESMRAAGHLTQLDTAFSRDQEHKIYAHDLMMQHARQVWSWLEEGAFFMCAAMLHEWLRT
jgi:hypothetical protein